jgi:hypothetical protein
MYELYASQPDRLFGVSAAADQTRAALIMMGEQVLTLGTAAMLLMWAHVERVAGRTAAEGVEPAAE